MPVRIIGELSEASCPALLARLLKVTAVPLYLLEELAGLSLGRDQRQKLVDLHPNDGEQPGETDEHDAQQNSQCACLSACHHRYLISRTKIQISHRPPVRNVMITSPMKLRHP